MNDRSMLEFVRGFIESHDPLGSKLTNRFPFRRLFGHCCRCSVWARRIALAEGADVEIAEVSALFHDIGKSADQTAEGHAEVGAGLCENYLTSAGYDAGKRTQIVGIVRHHIRHAHEPDASLEAKVESDADLLDETGAITVLWDAMACAGEESPSYEKACDRIARAYEDLKAKSPDCLHTRTARQILAGRLSCMGVFLKNLEYELGRRETVL